MAKKVNAVQFKGALSVGEMTITEETKDSIDVYDFLKVLQSFDGSQVAISIKEEEPVPQKDEE